MKWIATKLHFSSKVCLFGGGGNMNRLQDFQLKGHFYTWVKQTVWKNLLTGKNSVK